MKPSISRVHVILRRFGASPLLGLMLATTILMAAACESDPSASTHDGARGNQDDPAAGDTKTTPTGGGAYDPQAPTNQGPQLNPTGFAAIASIVEAHCGECHHAGTAIDLTSGADASTAAKIVTALEAGSMPPAPRTPVAAGDLTRIKAWRDGTMPSAAATAEVPEGAPITQLLDGATLATYKAALPKVGWSRLTKILASPATLFWDKATIPQAYQDTVGDGSSLPFGARLNSTGKSLIVPEGQKLFSEDGTTWSYPFGHTAGADASTNTFIVNFMSLPASAPGSALLPVAYRIDTGAVEGLPIKRWNWSFPVGTIVGEVIMLRDGDALVTSEIRTRERYASSWATDAFRPFPTAKTLSAAIKLKKPDWQAEAASNALVTALEDSTTLSAKQLDSPAFNDLVSLSGSVDVALPAFGDDDLVRGLLKSTTFVGVYGTAWKTSGAQQAFGATGPDTGLSVVPTKVDLGLLEVRESTCTKCHDQGGYFIGDLVDQAILYGDIWGVDRIFSFHPFDPSRIDASGNENRSVRPGLVGIVEAYDAAKHPPSLYSFYRPAK